MLHISLQNALSEQQRTTDEKDLFSSVVQLRCAFSQFRGKNRENASHTITDVLHAIKSVSWYNRIGSSHAKMPLSLRRQEYSICA